MKKTSAYLFAVCFAMLFLIAFPVAALAAGAASAWVNSVELTAATPYLKNGSWSAQATMPLSGGYAYFDAASSTLTLNNVLAYFPSSIPKTPLTEGTIHADGDLAIVLYGDNAIYGNATGSTTYYTIFAKGNLTIRGDGSAYINIPNHTSSAPAYGIAATADLTVESGSLSMDLKADNNCYGIYMGGDTLVSGGEIDINIASGGNIAMYGQNGTFTMTGGQLTATVTSSVTAFGLYYNQVSLQGGTIRTTATGGDYAFGAGYSSTLTYSGGSATFIGESAALFSYSGHASFSVTGGDVYVSESMNGSGLKLWSSTADGRLLANFTNESDFKYAQIIADEIIAPQTGDRYPLGFWAGAALIAGIACVTLGGYIRRKRRQETIS